MKSRFSSAIAILALLTNLVSPLQSYAEENQIVLDQNVRTTTVTAENSVVPEIVITGSGENHQDESSINIASDLMIERRGENLFSVKESKRANGRVTTVEKDIKTNSIRFLANASAVESVQVEAKPNTEYSIFADIVVNSGTSTANRVVVNNSDRLNSWAENKTVTTLDDGILEVIILSYRAENIDIEFNNIMVVEGSIRPTQYLEPELDRVLLPIDLLSDDKVVDL